MPMDRDVEGVVEMMLDATQGYDRPLTAKRLFDWHAALFPTGRSGMSKIRAGQRWAQRLPNNAFVLRLVALTRAKPPIE